VYALLVLFSLAVLAALLAFGALLFRYFHGVDYPGALLLSDQTRFRLSPVVRLSRSSTYQTTDSFSQVYIWYSAGFALGPEQYALGSCNQMWRRSEALLILETQMSVMVCDTPTGRMMFVERSLMLTWP
jgi:hypothetical protein